MAPFRKSLLFKSLAHTSFSSTTQTSFSRGRPFPPLPVSGHIFQVSVLYWLRSTWPSSCLILFCRLKYVLGQGVLSFVDSFSLLRLQFAYFWQNYPLFTSPVHKSHHATSKLSPSNNVTLVVLVRGSLSVHWTPTLSLRNGLPIHPSLIKEGFFHSTEICFFPSICSICSGGQLILFCIVWLRRVWCGELGFLPSPR